MATYPETLIIGTSDIVDNYNYRVSGLISPTDFKEIMTQVIQLLLNDDPDVIKYGDSFPDFSRLIDTSFLSDENTYLKITNATLTLVSEIHARLVENGVYCENVFSYFFDYFLGKDIVLKLLPY